MFYMIDTEELLDINFIKKKFVVFTAYGEALKKNLKPYTLDQVDQLQVEYDHTERLLGLIDQNRYSFIEIRDVLRHTKDLQGTINRLTDKEVLSVTEFFELKNLLYMVKKINTSQQNIDWTGLEDMYIDRLTHLESLLDPNQLGVNTFYIYDEYSPKLLDIRRERRTLEEKIARERKIRQASLQDALNIKIRPNGEITVSKEKKELIEKYDQHPELVYSSETYMNITFKIKGDDFVDQCLEAIETLKRDEDEEEYRVRTYLSECFNESVDQLQETLVALGRLDFSLGKAYFAKGISGVKPTLSEENVIEIQGAIHLKVQETLRKKEESFTPVTMTVKNGTTCITGANMGGKSVSLRTLGMTLAIAQLGLYVPAQSMTYCPKNFIFLSMGDAQSPDMGLSTFGAEMVNLKEVINIADHQGLILIDELARGTNPREGRAISKSVIEYLKDKSSISVITTHFDGLANDDDVLHLQVKGLANVCIDDMIFELSQDAEGIKTLHKYMDYQLREVNYTEKVPKDAINISILMGLNQEIIDKAKEYLGDSFEEDYCE